MNALSVAWKTLQFNKFEFWRRFWQLNTNFDGWNLNPTVQKLVWRLQMPFDGWKATSTVAYPIRLMRGLLDCWNSNLVVETRTLKIPSVEKPPWLLGSQFDSSKTTLTHQNQNSLLKSSILGEGVRIAENFKCCSVIPLTGNFKCWQSSSRTTHTFHCWNLRHWFNHPNTNMTAITKNGDVLVLIVDKQHSYRQAGHRFDL